MLGSIRCGDETYKIHPLGGGTTAVYEFDASQLRRHPPNWEGFVSEDRAQFPQDWQESMHRQTPGTTPEGGPGTPNVDADAGDEIDVLFAYTPEARRQQGNIDAFIQFAIDNANRIYRNSNVGLRLRAVHKYEVDYTQHSDMTRDLHRLTFTATDRFRDGSSPDPQGYMDEVHGLRDRYSADLVALIVGRVSNYCGYASIPDFHRNPNRDWADRGFSVTAQNCETLTYHTLAHELGHNQGGAHDPDNAGFSAFPYGHGLCNNAENWNTIMAYASNGQGDCRREIEYFSSPLLSYQGTLTGDAAVRDNRRVLIETAHRVANYRQSKPSPATTHTLAMVPPASDAFNLGFMRIINRSDRAGTVQILAIDDTGRRFGPVPYSLDARETKYFNSVDLEQGSDRRLPRGVGDGTGNWRLELSADVEIEPLAYIRTSDGFLTSMNALVTETQEGSTWRYHAPYFQPASPDGHRGQLRLINPGSGTASVKISGVDDYGNPGAGEMRFTLPAGTARNLTTEELEQGGSGLSGRLGDGVGRWQLSVSADARLQVMSLLKSVSGHLTNVSRGRSDDAVDGLPGAHHPHPVAQQLDATGAPPLVVLAESESRADQPPLPAEAAATLESIHADPAASGIRIGHSDPVPVLAARAMSFTPPSESESCTDSGQAAIAFTDVDIRYNDEGLASLYAQDAATDAEIALVIQDSDVLGSIRCGDETYKIHPLGGGMTAVYEFDGSQLRRHPESWGEFMHDSWKELIRDRERLVHGQGPDGTPHGDSGTPNIAADAGDEIDVLFAYTPQARAQQRNIDAFIQFTIDNTHRIYDNSNIGLRLRVVHKYQVNYTQDPSMETDLRRLTASAGDGTDQDPQGYMDEVHELRDRYGADLVVLIVGRHTARECGIAWRPPYGESPSHDFAPFGFSVMGQNCETLTYHTFAHEIGHNQGAAHDPFNASFGYSFSHGHGRCYNAGNWNTIMAYASNDQGDCRREIEYFSSPLLSYQGTPIGDAAVRDNRRVLIETAHRVANFRQSKTQPATTYTLAMVPPASDRFNLGFIRIVNRSDRAGTVQILAIDDTGRRFGPVPYSLDARETKYFNSVDLENGSDRRLPRGVGDGTGNWRLELSTDLDIEPLAYIRTSDGFLTSMNALAAESEEGSTWRYQVPYFQPASPDGHRGRLRLINPGAGVVRITLTGVDDYGNPGSGSVGLGLPAGAVRNLTTEELEQGGSGFAGRLGDGVGRWRLSVSADAHIQAPELPDLVVEPPSVSNSSLGPGESFQLSATVRNRGTGESDATNLRFYRSTDATISRSDTELQTASVSVLLPSGTSDGEITLTAPSELGTYYYGACVDSVAGESDTENNCSSAVRVTVSPGATVSVTSCPHQQVSSTVYSVTMRGTVQAHRSVFALTVTGYVDRRWLGARSLGDMSAGESSDFTITGAVVGSRAPVRCTAELEWSDSEGQDGPSRSSVGGRSEPLE